MLVQGASFSRYGSSQTDFSQETGKELESCSQVSWHSELLLTLICKGTLSSKWNGAH